MRRKRIVLGVAVVALLVGAALYWRYERALTDEERVFVGTWTYDSGDKVEFRHDHTFVIHAASPSEGRWSVSSRQLFMGKPDPYLPLLNDHVGSRVYTVTHIGPCNLHLVNESGATITLIR